MTGHSEKPGIEVEDIRNCRTRARLIAFYLPQFHPIPENDEWWGAGFTEWTNVAKAKPLFKGHYQPHVPSELGFYDLRVAETRAKQAALAASHGIEGFCYWHYWSDGRKLLEKPFEAVLSSGEPDFPFCLAWANETWTRRWEGNDRQVLWRQVYNGDEDDIRHIEYLVPALVDRRSLKVDGRPILLVYRPKDLPCANRTADIWRNRARQAGLPGLHLIAIDNNEGDLLNPDSLGFDAALDFQPNWSELYSIPFKTGLRGRKGSIDRLLGSTRLIGRPWRSLRRWQKRKSSNQSQSLILPYSTAVKILSQQLVTDKDQRRYPCVFPRWDNSPRKGRNAAILTGDDAGIFAEWLARAVSSLMNRNPDERLLFINAWNEWAEGNHLEPDLKYGRAYLEAVKQVVWE